MKWNWGTKLLIAIIVFMGFIFVLVYLSTQNDIYLVEKDYYPKGLKYQDRIDEIANARPLINQFRIIQFEHDVMVSLPPMQPDTGTILFFRPSGTHHDRLYQIAPDSNYSMRFPKSDFLKGKYVIRVYWRENEKGYFIEKPFYFN